MTRSFLIALVLVPLAAVSVRAEGFPSSNVTLLENLPLNVFPSNPGGGNDCWGYVSPGGREYALMGLRNAVAVVDITDPSGAVIVASIPHQDSNWCDIRTFGTYAYAVNETGGGLDVIDLSQVDSGIVTLVQRVTEAGLSTSHNISVNEESGFLYLCASNINEGRLVAMDLSDPANPVIAGNFPIAAGGVPHDAQIVSYTTGPYAGREIAFSSSGTDGLEIYDVTDKAAMFRVSTATYPNRVFTHQAWLSDDRHYLYVNDEFDFINETVIMDVSDIDTPTLVSTYSSGVDATDHNVFYHQGIIYEGEYRAGMRVFDAADPVNPVQIGWIDTFPGDDSSGSGGTWGVYPFLPSGKVLISDKQRGLFVVWPGPAPISFDFPAGTAPDRVDPGGETFEVQITADAGHVLDVTSAALVYDFGMGSVETSMVHLGGDLYAATFDPIPCGALVQYHVRAATQAGIAIRSPINAPCEALLAVAANASATVLQDDLESDQGWVIGAAGDSATQGVWERVDPVGNDQQPENDHTPLGDTCFITGQDPVDGSLGENDVDDGFTTLMTPPLDLSGTSKATIAYWRWYHNSFVRIDADEGNVPSDDVFVVSISDDDGLSWSLVEVVGPMGPETSGGWILHSFDAGALIDLTDQVRLRFVASDVGPLSIVEVGIDDLFVVSVSCGFPSSFCDASDGSLAACPCGNQGNPDTGCDIPQATGGVGLAVLAQSTSPNGATLQGTGFSTMGSPTAIVIRSSLPNLATPVVFGDGIRCLDDAGGLVRLAASNAMGGASTHTFGNGAMAGAGTKSYQLWFRSNPSTYCDAMAAFNLSNGRSLTW